MQKFAKRSMFRMMLLPLLLSASLTFQQVAGDCHDDSYDNCATCYQTLANALIDTDDNKYNLSRAFFPPDTAPPVLVKVTYHFKECSASTLNASDCDMIWYWTEGTFYIHQPLEVFVYRSLFFSSPALRQGSLELNLPEQCRVNASDDLYMFLTQRLKSYGTFQTPVLRVDNTYVAIAVNGEKKIDYKNDRKRGVRLNDVLHAYQCVPFVVVLVFLIGVVTFGGYSHHKSMGKKDNLSPEDVSKNTRQQADIAAVVAVCSCITVYNFVLDMLSLGAEENEDLPGYYERNKGIYIYTLVLAIVSMLFLLAGILWFIGVLVMWCRSSKDKKLGLFIPAALCIGSTALSLSFHIQYILIAWNIDHIYASRIGLYYGVAIFVYILTFRHAYFLPAHCWRDKSDDVEGGGGGEQGTQGRKKKVLAAVLGTVSVLVVGSFLTGIHTTNVVFYHYVSITFSIEESASSVQAIYDSVILLIGALIAYNVGWFYFHVKKFSLERALQKAMKDFPTDPFDTTQQITYNAKEKNWGKLSNEERLTQVIKALLLYSEHEKG